MVSFAPLASTSSTTVPPDGAEATGPAAANSTKLLALFRLGLRRAGFGFAFGARAIRAFSES